LSDGVRRSRNFDGGRKTLSLTVVEAVYRMTVDISSYRESFNKDEARSIPDWRIRKMRRLAGGRKSSTGAEYPLAPENIPSIGAAISVFRNSHRQSFPVFGASPLIALTIPISSIVVIGEGGGT